MDNPSDDPLVGRRINNKWQLLHKLSEGGIGLIYKGLDLESKQPIAVKLLRSQFHINNEVIERFRYEAQILKQLDHPHIIKTYDFDHHEELGFFMAMELLDGCDLEEYATHFPDGIDLQTLYRIFDPVCEAMHYAHSNGVIHRDLKPENIFLTGGPDRIDYVNILDFGIAKIQQEHMSRLTQTGMTLGTPRYLSPEQAMGMDLDQRADIYSLSVLLFELLTRRSLFYASNPYQYVMKHIYSPPPRLSDLREDLHFPEALEELIQSGLAKKPEDRPFTMRNFKVLLQDVCVPKKAPATSTPINLHTTNNSKADLLKTMETHLPPEEDIGQAFSHLFSMPFEAENLSSDSISSASKNEDIHSTFMQLEPIAFSDDASETPLDGKKTFLTQGNTSPDMAPFESSEDLAKKYDNQMSSMDISSTSKQLTPVPKKSFESAMSESWDEGWDDVDASWKNKPARKPTPEATKTDSQDVFDGAKTISNQINADNIPDLPPSRVVVRAPRSNGAKRRRALATPKENGANGKNHRISASAIRKEALVMDVFRSRMRLFFFFFIFMGVALWSFPNYIIPFMQEKKVTAQEKSEAQAKWASLQKAKFSYKK